MTDDEKKDELIYQCNYLFSDFLIANDMELEFPNWIDENDDYEKVEYLREASPEVINSFGEWLFHIAENGNLENYGVIPTDIPSWFYMSYKSDFDDEVLIHFTGDAVTVAKEGFKYGVDDMARLGLTTNLTQEAKKYGGYNFAYQLKDWVKYANGRNGLKYGNEAVLLRASGINVWHYTDKEPQAIFYGKTAYNLVPIREYNGSYYVANKKNQLIPIMDDNGEEIEMDLEQCVEWAIRNPQILQEENAIFHKK
jgi:hypothetical protein